MFKKQTFSLVVAAALTVLASQANAHETIKLSGFKMPESVIAAKDGRVFVSEIGAFGTDGDGQISVIDKKQQVQVFATGMDDPKGLTIVGKDLYVADKARILKVTPDGKWTVFVAADAFPTAPQFLNDLESDSKGNIYVSESGDLKGGWGAVYKIDRKGQVTTIVDKNKDARMASANGLLMDGPNNLFEVDFSTGILYRVEIATGAMQEVATGFGGGDGVARGKKGLLYVSDWKTGQVFSTTMDGETSLVQDGFTSAADIAISTDGRYLLVPDMKAGEVTYLPIH